MLVPTASGSRGASREPRWAVPSVGRTHDPMKSIEVRSAAVTAVPFDGEPSAAELEAIERELPLILAEVDLLDAYIVTLDRTPSELDERRIRRARRRVLAARRELANRAAGPVSVPGGAA